MSEEKWYAEDKIDQLAADIKEYFKQHPEKELNKLQMIQLIGISTMLYTLNAALDKLVAENTLKLRVNIGERLYSLKK